MAYRPGNEIAWSNDIFILNFLRSYYTVFHIVAFYIPIRNIQKFSVGTTWSLTGQMIECEHMRKWGNIISQSPYRRRLDWEMIPYRGIFSLSYTYIMSRGSVLDLEVSLPSIYLSGSSLKLSIPSAVARPKVLLSTNSQRLLAASDFPGIGDMTAFYLGKMWTFGPGPQCPVLECDAEEL